MGFGTPKDVTLARAREKAAQARAHIAAGRDPLEARRAERSIKTFGELADEFIETMRTQWRNDKHVAQWEMTLRDYLHHCGHMLSTRSVPKMSARVLKPLWLKLPETASRLRGRIERVLDAAKAQGLRTGENPARWRGHLDLLLPKRQQLTRGHHRAMVYADVAAFVAHLRTTSGVAAHALSSQY